MAGDPLTKADLDELAAHGIRYPWMPQDFLAALRKMKAQVPPAKPCGVCAAPLGGKFYSDVPTAQGKLDLCLGCHATRGTPPQVG